MSLNLLSTYKGILPYLITIQTVILLVEQDPCHDNDQVQLYRFLEMISKRK